MGIGSRRAAAIAVLSLVMGLLPLAGAALSHVDGEHDLQVTPEVESNPTGTTHTLTATLGAPAPAGGEEIDFEVESGPSVRTGCVVQPNGDCTGGTASNDGVTPALPDMTCTIPQGATVCEVRFTADASGTNLIRVWVDDDKNNATFDFDATEGRNAGNSDCPGNDCKNPGSQEGDRTEVDDTDVVEKTWFGALAPTTALDCSPEVATNPASGDGSSEVYTCQLFDNKGTSSTADDTALAQAGVAIDAENLNGANDPDNSSAAGTADHDNICTTGGNGSCTATIAASESQAGDALICFWSDPDGDAVFDPAGNDNDGGRCDEADELTNSGTASATTIGTTERDDNADVVRKTWVARGVATSIDCSPESDQNVRGTSHTVTCLVTDFFGDRVQGASVDFDVTGRNAAAQNNSTTNNQGQASFSYTDSNLALTQEGQADTIRGCIDPDPTAGCVGVAAAQVDTVMKFWFTTLPTATTVVLDMRNNGGLDNCEATDAAAEATDSNPVSETAGHLMCASAFSSTGAAIPGESVTFTLTGPGSFFDDQNGNGTKDAGEAALAGTTFTTTTDQAGHAFASVFSTATGTSTVTATADAASDTGTKVWTVAASEARNIDCTPNTDSNPPGTSHVVTCTVTDRFGNAVPGVTVSATETGTGRFSGPTSATTDAAGQVEFLTTTTAEETGTQSITATITSPRGGGATDDPCEQPAGTPAGAPAGNCSETVTKVWEGQATQCSDGIDNDGDGLVDFPADPGCDNAEDDDESDDGPAGGPCQNFAFGSRQPNPVGSGEIVVGTNGDDVLAGSDGDDIICGLDGNDIIAGGGGDDRIVGNQGNDSIEGNGGKDTINGNRDNDTIDGNRKNDVIRGSKGDDTIRGNRGHDTLRGGGGRDTLQGGKGDDILRGGGGNDTLKGFTGDDVLNGGSGRDTCKPGRGNDRVSNCER